MKKVFNYLRSMRFGILLLVLIAACSVVGTLIPQGREIAWYAQTYRSFHGVILLLRLNRVFESWYFITLLVLLCLNLTLCSVLRIFRVVRGAKTEVERAARLPDTVRLSPEGVENLREHLREQHFKTETCGGAEIFRRHSFGRYGSFLTHLSILLTVIFGALALYTPTVQDIPCMPGESVVLEDGTEIRVFDFHIADETGRLDYRSRVQIALPDGRSSEIAELWVNHPFSFGSWKLFQQSFGTAGSLTVTDPATGGSDVFYLTEQSFLSADGRSGLMYDTLYPDYVRSPGGEVTLITITEGTYPNPIYQVEVISDGVNTPALAVPGDELEVLGLRFAFNDPVEYPGLRVKHVSRLWNGMLVAAFALMVAGLTVTFFYEPALIRLDADGYAVGGPKPERMRVELGELFGEYETDSGEKERAE
ncbi:MAG: cytochrome c biogenesis protein ResB [Oscillospiraceae bacterium]|nr:cytochrome c biogenesis protein ResB [Oscillospiraceae bacterium]